MNVIIPIAGANKAAETEYIKSLQEIERKTVIQYAFESRAGPLCAWMRMTM